MFKSVSHRAVYAKMKIVQPLAQEFISAAGKGGIAHNVRVFAMAGNLSPTPCTKANFFTAEDNHKCSIVFG